MEQFELICKSLNIPQELLNRWSNQIWNQYTGEQRRYHNLHTLGKKLDLINDFVDKPFDKTALILASYFQHYHFNTKQSSQENCNEFRLFVREAGIKDVRTVDVL